MSSLGQLHPGLQLWIKEQNWPGLRPVQEAALEPILAGQSCVIEAPTAGGKTEAVLFPSLTRASRHKRESVQVLYIAPLRALLNNLAPRAERYAKACNLDAFKWHGDVSQTDTVRQLRSPPQLLLTTPESVEAIMLRKAEWNSFFSELEIVIIDEAHNLAAGDRGTHLLSLLERLEAGTGARPQRIALSATIGNPDAMCAWLMGAREPAIRVKVNQRNSVRRDFLVHHYDDTADSADTPEPAPGRGSMMGEIIRELQGRRSITFVRSRKSAEGVATAIESISNGRVVVRTHHGNVGKFYREEAERLIRIAGEGGIHSIVSTSTLELGIDIGELDAVLQLGALSSPSAFLQRVGRTGRRKGMSQYFRGFTQALDDLLLLAATVSLGLEHRSEELRLNRRALHVLAHQILCLSLQEHGARPDLIWQTLKSAYSFSDVERHEFDAIVRHMVREQYLRVADGLLVAGEKAEKRYLVAGWRHLFATFNSAPLYDVMVGRTQVGTLDTSFVSGLEVPFVFSLGGKAWRASSVDHDSRTIKAVTASGGSAPKWSGFGGPDVPFETAQRAGELLHGHVELPDVFAGPARGSLESMFRSGDGVWRPGGIALMVLAGGQVSLETFAGDAINRTLARLLEAAGLTVKGDYVALTLQNDDGTEDQVEAAVHSVLHRIRHAPEAELRSELTERQRAYSFSPFTQMLPDELVRSALVSQSTDLDGLRSYVEQALRAEQTGT